MGASDGKGSGVSGHLSIRPGVACGAPTFATTGTAVWAVVGSIWAGDDVDTMARDYGLIREDVLVGCWFVATYGTEGAWWNGSKRHNPGRVWVKRWGAWASENAERFWRSQYDEIPDPPSREDA